MTGIPFTDREVTALRLALSTHLSRPIPHHIPPDQVIQPASWGESGVWVVYFGKEKRDVITCPYRRGQEYFVKETWRVHGGPEYEYQRHQPSVRYHEAADATSQISNEWKSALTMKRWAARFTLTIRDIAAVRLNAMTDAIAQKHGFADVADFRKDWDRRYAGKGAESARNPYVWQVEFDPFDVSVK